MLHQATAPAGLGFKLALPGKSWVSSDAAFFGAVYLVLVQVLGLRSSVSSFCEVRGHFNLRGVFPDNDFCEIFEQ